MEKCQNRSSLGFIPGLKVEETREKIFSKTKTWETFGRKTSMMDGGWSSTKLILSSQLRDSRRRVLNLWKYRSQVDVKGIKRNVYLINYRISSSRRTFPRCSPLYFRQLRSRTHLVTYFGVEIILPGNFLEIDTNSNVSFDIRILIASKCIFLIWKILYPEKYFNSIGSD